MADYYDLGHHSLRVTTSSPDAHLWFDRGLLQCYGFNHGEAVRCFRRALEADPGWAMAYWGVAFALGPNYNKPWEAFDAAEFKSAFAEAREATSRANGLLDGVSELERILIQSLEYRYPEHPTEQEPARWVEAYSARMLEIQRLFPQHPDISTLVADALMNRTPWKLWDLKTGDAAEGSSTVVTIEILETALRQIDDSQSPRHPGLLHMYIHLMEMSPHPERALRAADQLRHLVPDAGHLQHMPTHIYALCGHFQSVVDSNDAAIIADRKYLEREGPGNFYSLYRCHNYHFKVYGPCSSGIIASPWRRPRR